jgi:hypothetical protein
LIVKPIQAFVKFVIAELVQLWVLFYLFSIVEALTEIISAILPSVFILLNIISIVTQPL